MNTSPPAPVETVRVPEDDFDWTAEGGVAAGVRRVVEAAMLEDGHSPLNEQALLSLRHRGLSAASLWVADSPAPPEPGATPEAAASRQAAVAGFALVDETSGDREVELNLAVDPAARSAGLGMALASATVEAYPSATISAWSHGNHPAAAVLARRLGFTRARDLWVMRRPLQDPAAPLPAAPLPAAPPPGAQPAAAPPPANRQEILAEPSTSSRPPVNKFRIRTFEPGRDETGFLAVNAAAFAHHPEQGNLTRADLDQRMAEPWFDPAGFFVAESTSSDDAMLGFHWTKVHAGAAGAPAYGEVYVVGIAPEAQGMGLGKALTLAGLHHLQSAGLGEVVLYVESDNAPAIAVYGGLGFSHADVDTDVMYVRTP